MLGAPLSACGGGSSEGSAQPAATPLQLAATPASPNPSTFASLSAAQAHPAGSEELAAYTMLNSETPNPVPGRDLRTSPLGSTIYISAREDNRIVITSAAMTQAATGEAVVLRTPVTEANDPFGPCQTGCFESHQAYVVPDVPLQPNTACSVSVSGTNNGSAFSRNFIFSTGSD